MCVARVARHVALRHLLPHRTGGIRVAVTTVSVVLIVLLNLSPCGDPFGVTGLAGAGVSRTPCPATGRVTNSRRVDSQNVE